MFPRAKRSAVEASHRVTREVAVILALLMLCLHASAVEVIPPAPAHYFNDYALAVRPEVASGLDATLEQFERDTSSQIVVAIFPKMQTDSSIEDYSQRIFESWKPGRANLDQGALLLVFVQDRKMRIHTGYGLEGALPDSICKRIIDDEIAPRLKTGDFDGGMTAGVNAILAATKGEYHGTGRTVQDEKSTVHGQALGPLLFFGLIFGASLLSSLVRRKSTTYSRSGRRSGFGWALASALSSGGGGGGSSGGGGGSSGGGFSGGGGSSGGGGASGGW